MIGLFGRAWGWVGCRLFLFGWRAFDAYLNEAVWVSAILQWEFNDLEFILSILAEVQISFTQQLRPVSSDSEFGHLGLSRIAFSVHIHYCINLEFLIYDSGTDVLIDDSALSLRLLVAYT